MAKKKFKQNNNNLAIAYYRYSSHAQNEASIEQQQEAAQKYAAGLAKAFPLEGKVARRSRDG